MKKNLVIFLLLIILACLFFPRYVFYRSEESRLERAAQKKEIPSFKVMTMKADARPIEITLPSYLEAINTTPIWARTNGYLIDFLVDIGDRVEEGQLLADIDTPDVTQEWMRSQGELASRIAKEEIARITAERWVHLYEKNPQSLSKEEVDQMVAAYKAAAADVAAAQANADYWKTLQDFKYIYAPFDGIITVRKAIDIGTLITSGSANNPIELFHIARTDVLRAFVDVPQSIFYLIEDGMSAEVSIWQYPGKTFQGVIDRNAGALDPQARTLLTQVNIDNQDNALMPGLYAEVAFKFTPKQKTFLIPVGALIIRSGPPYVAVIQRNSIHLKQVKIGIDDGQWIEIVEGLQEGDQIVIQPSDLTKEGLAAHPVPISKEEERKLLYRSSVR